MYNGPPEARERIYEQQVRGRSAQLHQSQHRCCARAQASQAAAASALQYGRQRGGQRGAADVTAARWPCTQVARRGKSKGGGGGGPGFHVLLTTYDFLMGKADRPRLSK